MADMIRVTDTSGNDHYVAWASIADVQFTKASNGLAYIITTATTMQPGAPQQSHYVSVSGDVAEALRNLLDTRAETIGSAGSGPVQGGTIGSRHDSLNG